MPDGPRIGAADGGRHGLPGGTARAHEPPLASARLTDGVPRIAGPAITPVVCDSAQRASAWFAACRPGIRGALVTALSGPPHRIAGRHPVSRQHAGHTRAG